MHSKYSSLLHKIINYYNYKSVLELGTSLGITTSYLAKANTEVVTIEGCNEISKIATSTFNKLSLKNIKLIMGEFNNVLPNLLSNSKPFDMILIDGNHKYQATVDYFEMLVNNINENSLIVFDDIHWSDEMEKAWNEIKNDKRVSISIDIFQLGLIFFRKGINKQDYTIKF